MRVPIQETGLSTSFMVSKRRGRGPGVAPSCTCNAAGVVIDDNCGSQYHPQCLPNQATGTYTCNCIR